MCTGFREIIKEVWNIATKAEKNNDIKNKLQLLVLTKDAYKLE